MLSILSIENPSYEVYNREQKRTDVLNFLLDATKGGRIVETDERTNVEKLAAFVEEEEASLLPAFLTLLEMCFHGQEHGLEKF